MTQQKNHDQQHSPEDLESCPPTPTEDNNNESDAPQNHHPTSAFQQLAILDRFLALWIFLAMGIGIILGNFVPDIERSLQRGEFVGVSIPIGGSSVCML